MACLTYLRRKRADARRRHVEQLNQELEARVQARTQEAEAARAEAERQRQQWYDLFMRAPASICIFDGPQWVYQFVNPCYQAMFPGRALLGKRLVDALPEVADQPLMAILHRVYDTGEPLQRSELLVPLARTEGGPIEDIYFDLTYLARYNEAGQIDGFVTYAYDVTAQVLARRARRPAPASATALPARPGRHLHPQGPGTGLRVPQPPLPTVFPRTPVAG
jgi:PAS domain-containing protein